MFGDIMSRAAEKRAEYGSEMLKVLSVSAD